MLAAVPSLRAFAISLCGNVDRADDLVQEALLRAWGNLDSFEPGTNMSAWLFTILRNVFRSEYRKRRREVEDADGSYADSLISLPNQTSSLEMDEFRKALDHLPAGGLCSEGRFKAGDARQQDRRLCSGGWHRRWVGGSVPTTSKPCRRLRGRGSGSSRHVAGGRVAATANSW